MSRGVVEVAPLRDAFLRSGRSAAEVATALDWRRLKRPGFDGHRVRRYLSRERCDYATAVRLAEAIGVDPFEVGV